jgi:lipopolysaccharide/colanic/teichoic acid biosynthesis glycosyltransferase
MLAFEENRRTTALILATADAAILVASVVAATWIRFGTRLFEGEFHRLLEHPGFVAYLLASQLALSTAFDLYRPQSWRTKDYLLLRMVALVVALAVALALGVYMVQGWRFGRGLLALTLVLAIPAQAALRYIWLVVGALPAPQRALVIGDGPIVSALESELEHRPNPPFVIDRHLPAPVGEPAPMLSSNDLAGVDLVVVASLADDATVDRLSALNFGGTPVMDAAGAYAALTGRIPVRQVDSRWFIATGDFSSIATSPFHRVQRLLDVMVATGLLILGLPVLIVAVLTTLICDGRPLLFTQTRRGRFGVPFVLYKLRTMQRGSDVEGPTFAEPDDERILTVGRFQRRWRIDELPQLLNVLRGDMSLVGPRPERPDVADELEREIPFYAYRYSVRPGITGWAQVHLPYCRNIDDHTAKLEFDLYMLRHYGAAMYAIVLIRTLGALIFRPTR